jgi:hypothetical protein
MAQHELTIEQWNVTQAALDKHDGNKTLAALEIGLKRQTIQHRIIVAKAKGWLADDGTVPDGFLVKGVSTLYDGDGNKRAQWVKTREDAERQEAMLRETVAEFVKAIKPAKPIPPPKINLDHLAVAYAIGDAHLGLYAWGAETGADFDLAIAERDLMSAASRLIMSAPASSECIVVQLGDFYHMDDSRNVTPASGNRLDVDSRFPKVIRVGIRTMRFVIDEALKKHKLVRVRNVAGNHDPHASVTLTEALIGYYHDEPRVIIESSPRPFFVWRFGSNLVGITHGHAGKPEALPGVLAVDAQKEWGECSHRFIWHGHIHQKRVFESMGVVVESFRTLAGRDAWHTEQGYRPGREMQAIVLHRDFGEVERHTASIQRVRAE